MADVSRGVLLGRTLVSGGFWVSGGSYTSLPNALTIVEKSRRELTWFNDFSSRVLDNNLSPIQVFDEELAATQRLHQPDLVVYEQVISISLEGLKMRGKHSLISLKTASDAVC